MPSRSQIYINEILSPCFEVAKRRFYAAMMEVNLAHTLMLAQQEIIPIAVARPLCTALLARLEKPPENGYDSRYEDLFFLIEAQIAADVGADQAAQMHVAFSRNDLDAAIFRMALRHDLLGLIDRLQVIRTAIVDLADAHVQTVMPAHTHNQQAQPTTLAHYLLAVEGNLRRDTERLQSLYGRVNCSPMGAAALATTGFPIDRELVGRYLGFEGLVENSYDAVSASDHMVETVSTIAILASNLSRFVYDLMLYTSNEFGVLTLDDSLVQISSIMPQKRNPVALEHLRAVLSRLIGRCTAILPLVHNVPLGDINDVGDDLQPMVEEVFAEANRGLGLLHEVLGKSHFDTALLAERARTGFASVTELADSLVREGSIPFRQAHHVVTRFVLHLREANRTLPDGTLTELDRIAQDLLGRPTGLSEESYRQAIDPRTFVERRAIIGGPAPREVQRALQSARDSVQVARQTCHQRQTLLQSARSHLLADAQNL
jgi:argininosuccinate lyase